MALQKYRAHISKPQADGAVVWCSQWMGGEPVAKVDNCRMANLSGEPRVTAYMQGEPDTMFSIPAKCRYLGATVGGYLTTDDDGNLVFRHTYY